VIAYLRTLADSPVRCRREVKFRTCAWTSDDQRQRPGIAWPFSYLTHACRFGMIMPVLSDVSSHRRRSQRYHEEKETQKVETLPYMRPQ